MPSAPYAIYGSGSQLLFAFHGYGMDGWQFQVLRKSLCEQHQVVGFHLPYHKGGPRDHSGWIIAVLACIKDLLRENENQYFSIAGYSIGAKVALSVLHHFKDQIKHVYLFAPYGLTSHWGISFLESGWGKGLFRIVAGTHLPSIIVKWIHLLGIISQADHEILQRELDSSVKRQHLQKTFVLMSEIRINIDEVLNDLLSVSGKVQLVFGKQDEIFPLSRLKGRDRIKEVEVLELDHGHWLMTEKLETLLLTQ